MANDPSSGGAGGEADVRVPPLMSTQRYERDEPRTNVNDRSSFRRNFASTPLALWLESRDFYAGPRSDRFR
jgi:hypothetical protein